VVLTPSGALDMINRCRQLTVGLEKAGVVTQLDKKASIATN
jgi:hypothetical protein